MFSAGGQYGWYPSRSSWRATPVKIMRAVMIEFCSSGVKALVRSSIQSVSSSIERCFIPQRYAGVAAGRVILVRFSG